MTHELTDLLVESRQRGFLGPGPVEIHLDHARAFAVGLDGPPDTALDLGAGGGLPGLVLAVECWPETSWVFLDAQQKRSAFLGLAVESLGLQSRVTVITDRAENLGRLPGHRAAYDLVVARSFAAPAITAECAAPLLRLGGTFLASEPPDATTTTRWPETKLMELGWSAPEPLLVGPGSGYHLVRCHQGSLCPERYPRRVGIPAKRPLW